tara:strand:- start:109 stop:273 length:165 start_codon:yes stop_codon:yes gene_type:complete
MIWFPKTISFSVFYKGIVIEAENEKNAKDVVQSYLKINPERLLDYPKDIINKIL